MNQLSKADMSTATFRVVYDGPALAEHTMDVRELAPALLAIAEALEEANRILNGDRAQVRVQVHGSFKTGSFGIDLDVTQAFIAQALDFLANDRRVVGSLNLLALLGFVGATGTCTYKGVLALLKWLRGRTVRKVEIDDDRGVAKVITDDEAMEVEVAAIELFRSYKIRESIERAIKVPLEREGVETVAFVYEEHVVEVVEKYERHAFTPPPDQKTQINEMELTAPLQLVSVPLRDGYKWRVDDGNGSFTATVLDERFVQRIHKSEIAFAAGDILFARLRRRQFLEGAELRNENEIVEVLKHESAYKQIPLPITRPDA